MLILILLKKPLRRTTESLTCGYCIYVVCTSTYVICLYVCTYVVFYVCCLVGHGRSDGDRVHIEDFQIYARDIIQHIEILKDKYGNIPFFLLGHSMVSYMYYAILCSTKCLRTKNT